MVLPVNSSGNKDYNNFEIYEKVSGGDYVKKRRNREEQRKSAVSYQILSPGLVKKACSHYHGRYEKEVFTIINSRGINVYIKSFVAILSLSVLIFGLGDMIAKLQFMYGKSRQKGLVCESAFVACLRF